jgi:hypothetical protein
MGSIFSRFFDRSNSGSYVVGYTTAKKDYLTVEYIPAGEESERDKSILRAAQARRRVSTRDNAEEPRTDRIRSRATGNEEDNSGKKSGA